MRRAEGSPRASGAVRRAAARAGAGLALALLAGLAPSGAPADEIEGGESEWEVIEDPILRQMRQLDELAPFEDMAPLWDHLDPGLQKRVDLVIEKLGLQDYAKRRQLSVALIDITDLEAPKVAQVNGDVMMYAASLPKIAVLLAAFESVAQGKLEMDADLLRKMRAMIHESSNSAATDLMNQVGKEQIARVLLSPRYRLYDPSHNGGLWVGKDYAKAGLWRRDPLHNLSHGATAMQVARFYYLLQTGNLVTPEYSRQMKQILAGTKLEHKFVRALRRLKPKAQMARKSGSWGTYHSDSALVEHDGRAYIAVALSNSDKGNSWLGPLIIGFDHIIFQEKRRASWEASDAGRPAPAGGTTR